MDLTITVNEVEIPLDGAADGDLLRRAGLEHVPRWQRWLRGDGSGGDCWEATDPRVVCFEGAVEVYPCRDGYLDPDRRWGTGCRVVVERDRVARVEIRVIDGKYAAGNLFERFCEAGERLLGEAAMQADGQITWHTDRWLVEAAMAEDAVNAGFLFAAQSDLLLEPDVVQVEGERAPLPAQRPDEGRLDP